VRSRSRGRHVVRVAFPPGPRRKGAGQVIQILHPKDEKNPSCILSNKARTNPGELLIFGNPAKNGHRGTETQSKLEKQRAARDRAEKIRGARLNPKRKRKLSIAETHQKRVQEILAKMPKPIRDVFDRNPSLSSKELVWVRQRMEQILAAAGKLFPRDYTKADLERAHAQAVAELKKKANPRRRRKDRRNPSEEQQAVQLYQSFHGKDPSAIVEKHVSAAIRLDYTALGDLEYIKVATPIGQKATFEFDSDHVKLASSPDGKQLYAIGGNQNLASCIDKDSLEKDFIDLGDGMEVSYLARKVHGDFRPVSYFHKFGEIDGTLPRMMFDKLKKQIFFVGGNYFIDTSKGVSPGIEN
jgi:hypothetical protein